MTDLTRRAQERAAAEAYHRAVDERRLNQIWSDVVGAVLAVPEIDGDEPWLHEGHQAVQHRDGRRPWCNTCGYSDPYPAIPARQEKVL